MKDEREQRMSQTSPERGPLMRDPAFLGLTLTQFLGAFNDNVFKQMILLLAIPAVAAMNAKQEADIQGWATFVFSIPFVLFSGYAGFLSDRYAKRPIIVASKVAEIVVMFLGLFAFLAYDVWGSYGTWTVLFLMGTQSAFFGPGKYGILPELFREKDLPRANGIILMTTFLAIIFGTVIAGKLSDWLVPDARLPGAARSLWFGSAICVGIAVLGTWTSLWIRRTPAAQPDIRLKIEDWGLSKDIRELLAKDKPLLAALLVSCAFWLISGIAVLVVNQLGVQQLKVSKFLTSMLVAAIGLGIMLGSVGANRFLKQVKPRQQITLGLWGIFVTLVILGGWKAGGQAILGYWGSFVMLLLLGVAAAIYAIPLQVFLQSRPPVTLKGRMIATMNQANFIGILISGPLYQFFEWICRSQALPISAAFWMIAAIILPIAIRYRLSDQPTAS